MTSQTIPCIEIQEMISLMQDDSTVVLDVREPVEVAQEYLPEAHTIPLSKLAQACSQLDSGKNIVLVCQSGQRALKASSVLTQKGFKGLYILEGGLNAWKQSGQPLTKGTTKVWSLMRQVQFTAGLMVATSVALGFWVHPGFLGIAGFVGLGLAFAGLTNTCGMALLLAKMPWNKNVSCNAPGN